MSNLSHPAAAFGLGVALGAAPGPVQVLLLSESSLGGVRRGLRVMVGVSAVFLAVLVLLALGLSSIRPSIGLLRVVRVAGGAFLLWVAADTLRAIRRPPDVGVEERQPRLDLIVRGMLAVVLSPGAWVFFATSAPAVVADASLAGGVALALVTGAAMATGTALSDFSVVILGSGGRRLLTERLRRRVDAVLGAALAALGVWFIVAGLAP